MISYTQSNSWLVSWMQFSTKTTSSPSLCQLSKQGDGAIDGPGETEMFFIVLNKKYTSMVDSINGKIRLSEHDLANRKRKHELMAEVSGRRASEAFWWRYEDFSSSWLEMSHCWITGLGCVAEQCQAGPVVCQGTARPWPAWVPSYPQHYLLKHVTSTPPPLHTWTQRGGRLTNI